jgi:putative heme-binding domain-containing protein
VNCSHCHQPHAGGTATIELMYDVKLEDAKLLGVRPSQGTFGIAEGKIVAPGDPLGSVLLYRISKLGGGRMPRVGSNEVDEQAIAMFYEWIDQMPRTPSAETIGQEANLAEQRANDLNEELIQKLTASTRGAMALMRRIDRGDLPTKTRDQVIAIAAQHPQTEVRDLFERFIPPAQRLKRLGDQVNIAELLMLSGDAERGKQIFFREGAASCKSCHRIAGVGEMIGPDLSQIGKKYPRPDLLTQLLEPSKFMEPQYVPVVVETVDGRVITGLLKEKNEREVVLRDALQEYHISAADVESLVAQQKSLMPDLLLRDLTPQQAADLLEYLSSLK